MSICSIDGYETKESCESAKGVWTEKAVNKPIAKLKKEETISSYINGGRRRRRRRSRRSRKSKRKSRRGKKSRKSRKGKKKSRRRRSRRRR